MITKRKKIQDIKNIIMHLEHAMEAVMDANEPVVGAPSRIVTALHIAKNLVSKIDGEKIENN